MSSSPTPTELALKRDRLHPFTKISYGLGTSVDMWGIWLYFSVAYGVFNIYLQVPALYVGIALMLIRVIDAVSDPLAGWFSDNMRSKHGRRRPFILIAGIASGLGLPCLFLVSPSWVDLTILGMPVIFLYMVGSSMIFIPIVSMFSMPYHSLGAELTPDYDERSSLMKYKQAMQKIFEVGNFYALKFTNLSWFLIPGTEEKNTLLGIQVFTSILGVIMALCAIFIFFNVKERYYSYVVRSRQEPIQFKETLYQTAQCRPFLVILGAALAFQIGTSMVGALGYYTTVYYVSGGDTRMGDDWNFWMGVAFMVGGFLGAIGLGSFAQVTNKKLAYYVALIIGVGAYGSSWFLYTPAIPWLQVLASGSMAFAAGGLWTLHSSIVADIIDYDELHNGKRREGAFSACGSWILKAGNALGFLFSGIILDLVRFDPALRGDQAEGTIFGIRFALMALPIAGLLISMLIMTRFKIKRAEFEGIRAQLEARRGEV